MDAFMHEGFNMIDTADMYSRWAPGNKGGESETIIGKWQKQKGGRDKMIIATKVGNDMGDRKKGVTKKYILTAVEDSLRRLQTDYIDLYQTHFDDEATPVEETMAAYNELVKVGKVRFAGTSNMSVERIKASLNVSAQNNYPAYQTLQPLYNLYEREKFEKEYEALCLENNIGVINYFSLASGFLTGKYRSEKDTGKSVRGGGMSKYFNERGFNILTALDEVAAKHNSKPAAIAIAWLNAKPAVTAPIASATNLAQLEELMRAAQLQLDENDMNVLDNASSY